MYTVTVADITHDTQEVQCYLETSKSKELAKDHWQFEMYTLYTYPRPAPRSPINPDTYAQSPRVCNTPLYMRVCDLCMHKIQQTM